MKLFKPEIVCKTIFDIKIETLKEMGVKLVLLDIDNTLIAWDSDEITEKHRRWIDLLKNSGITVRILSNANEKRVRTISNELNVNGVGMALKPLWINYIKSLKEEGFAKKETIMIGDQVFTDLLGAKISGIKCILVDPISNKELKSTKFMRKLEKFIRN